MIKEIFKLLKGFKKNQENLALVTVALFIVVMIIIVVSTLTSLLPDNLKFNVEIYGTVSDWIIVIVTIVTAVFVYKTLTSQQKVQFDQERMNLLTSVEIRNNYKAEIELLNPQIEETLGFFTNIWIFKIKGNDALNIQVLTNTSHTIENFGATTIFDDNRFLSKISMISANNDLSLVVNDKERISYIMNLTKENSENKYYDWLSFDITYHDNFKFKYGKRFLISFNPHNEHLNITTSNTEFFN